MWGAQNYKERELSKLEMLIEEMKLNNNLLLRDVLEMDDVRALDCVLEREGEHWIVYWSERVSIGLCIGARG
jgi:hypothetical protein